MARTSAPRNASSVTSDRPVGSHGERPTDRGHRPLRTHRHDRHLALGGLGELQGRFDGVLVARVQGALAVSFHQEVVAELGVAVRIRDGLHEHHDVHAGPRIPAEDMGRRAR